MKKGGGKMAKKSEEISIRSSAAEYLTYVATVGDQQDSIEMHGELEQSFWDSRQFLRQDFNKCLVKIIQDTILLRAQ